MKRRTVLQAFASIASASVVHESHALGSPKIDSRLLGTWRSDKARTAERWCYQKEQSPEKREQFESIFGKFTVRFSETHVETEYEGQTDKSTYTVVASDADSVVVLWADKLQHIHFDNNGYYVLSGFNVEFFLRVEAQQSLPADVPAAASRRQGHG